MSSLRNAVKRITHKERSQPRSRSHLGFLEKKQDYKRRAKDHHAKQDRLNRMREKASMRNPDEFYFGMHNSEVVDGKHRKTQQAEQKAFEEQVGMDTIRIMKDQDLSYVRMQRQADAKKIERLKASLHFLDEDNHAGGVKKRKHTIFVDSAEEAKDFDVAKHFDTLPELAGRAFNRPRIESLKKAALESAANGADEYDDDDDDDNDGEEKKLSYLSREDWLLQSQAKKRELEREVSRARAVAYQELEARRKRVAALTRAEAHLLTEKQVAAKGPKRRKIKAAEDGNPAQYEWSRKRLK